MYVKENPDKNIYAYLTLQKSQISFLFLEEIKSVMKAAGTYSESTNIAVKDWTNFLEFYDDYDDEDDIEHCWDTVERRQYFNLISISELCRTFSDYQTKEHHVQGSSSNRI